MASWSPAATASTMQWRIWSFKTDRRQLHQDLGAVVALLYHSLHLFQVANGPGKAVDDGFLILVHMSMAVWDSVSVEIGVIVVMLVCMVVLVGMVVIVLMQV